MDATRWQLIRALFDDLIELDPLTWEQALLSRHPDDAELRCEVIEMLRADVEARDAPSCLADRSPELLGQMADAEDAQQVQGWIGRQLGAWRIVRPLGRGGMGMVYLAEREDGQFRQQAAIKLLRLDDDDGGMQRFLAERQILAGLDHPNIAHLLDGGREPDGVPWFALEYVDGMALTAWCDSRRLGIRERLLLFLDICAAVSYAHEHLVVHRDLKPANILVDTAGHVKLLDFGIAKLQEADADQTRTALRMFTPEYAAPEQVRGERATTATDVYALGVILYELLTGRRPYRVAERTPQAIEYAILTNDPPRPSGVATQRASDPSIDPDTAMLAANRGLSPVQLRARLRGDLDAIILKALRKEARARYSSVRAFADDLRNFLALRPVTAHKGGFRYHADRYLRRNALAVTLSGVAFLALTVGLMVSLVQTREARLQRDVAEREAATSREALAFMEGLFKLADPVAAEGREITARELLDRGRARIAQALSTEPIAQIRLLLAMGEAYRGLGLDAQALPLFDDAQRLQSGSSTIELTERIALNRAAALLGLGRYEEVEQELGPLRKRIEGSSPAQRLRASDFDYYLGRAASALGKYEIAAPLLESALQIRETELELTDPKTQEIVESLIAFYQQFSNDAKSVQLAERSLAAFVERGDTDDVHYADALSALAMVRSNIGPLSEAESLRREALRIYRKIYGDKHTETVGAVNDLATVLFAQRKYAEVVPVFREVLEARRQLLGNDHPAVANAANNLSIALLMNDDAESALAYAQEGLRIRDSALGRKHRSTAASLAAVGGALLVLGRLDAAEEHSREALAIYESIYGPRNGQAPPLLNNLARIELAREVAPIDCRHSSLSVELQNADPPGDELPKLYAVALNLACEARRGSGVEAAQVHEIVSRYRENAASGDPYIAILERIVSGLPKT